jgi:hypothetical protein
LVLALAVALGPATGCGGDDTGSPGDGAVGATTTSVTVEPALAPFCDAFGALLSGPLAGDLDASDPEVLRTAVELTQVTVDELRAAAPPEIAQAAGAVADDYERTFAVLARYGYDLARFDAEATAEDRAVFDAFGQPPSGPDAPDPAADLEAYVADHCAPGATIPEDLG